MKNIQEFVREITAKHKTGKATEHTYRAALEKLIKGVSGNKLQVLNEGKATELHLGKPDLIIGSGDILIGCIEAKDIDKDLSDKEYEEQFTRYRNGIENLIITNCLDWDLYKNGELEESVTIGTLRGDDISLENGRFDKLLAILQKFTGYKGLKITSSKKLATIMANRAKGLKITLLGILKKKTGDPNLLQKQFKLFRENIINDLEASTFADMYAQTITYGLFVSWLNSDKPNNFSREEAKKGLSNNNTPFLKGFFKDFLDEDIDGTLNWDIENIIDLFRITDRNIFSESEKRDLFIHFYEDFLTLYDKKVKKTRGVYYTPIEVVKYIVNSVDEILQKDFKLKGGLSDGLSKTTYEYLEQDPNKGAKRSKKTVDTVQVLDPATGTGTFLVEVIKKIYEKYKDGKQGIWEDYVRDSLLENLHGFEILMTPYVMCHLKLNMVLKETGYKFKSHKRYNICLTNALDKTVGADLYFDWLEEEAKLAKNIKDYRPIKVVIGNPPYNVKSSNKSEFIQKLMVAYKKGLGVEAERNKKPLSDDYIKFIRLAEDFVSRNRGGIVAFITNNSFLDGVLHRQMRKHLLETFDKIYIINLHGNTIIGETTPDGSRDESVFDVTVGTSINIFVKTSLKGENGEYAKVYYKDIYGSRDRKYTWLKETRLHQTDFTELHPRDSYYFFVPKDPSSPKVDSRREEFGVDELFAVTSSGVITRDDDTLVSFSPFDGENNKVYTYKPFDTRYVNYDLTKIERGRKKVMRHFMAGENFGLCICRQQHSSAGFSHVFVTTNILDAHSLSGWTHVAPLYLYDLLAENRSHNFNPKTLNVIEHKLNMKAGEDFTPENLFDYVYAVLHSTRYRDRDEERLRTNFPSIPLPKDKNYFFKIATYGERLRNIHLLDPSSLASCSPYIDIGFPNAGDNIISSVKFKDNKVYINKTQYFTNVPKEAWDFYVGDYQPLQTWLKYRKKTHYVLTSDDFGHYERMVNAIAETMRIMEDIDRIIQLP